MAKWNIDPDHSVAAFNVRHMMAAHVRGQFNKLSGSAQFDPADRSSFSLEVTIDATGLYTGIAQRDEHLSSPDFFDMATYPAISFKNTGFKASGDGGMLAGDLNIHGVTQPKFSGPVVGPENFGMVWNVPMDDGGVVVGKDIWIDLDIEADLE